MLLDWQRGHMIAQRRASLGQKTGASFSPVSWTSLHGSIVPSLTWLLSDGRFVIVNEISIR